MSRTLRSLACAVAIAAALPAAAVAQDGSETLPPDNAAVDQYVDPLPGFDGDRPAGTPGGGGGGVAGGDDGKKPENGLSDVPLPLETQKELAEEGPDGFRVAGFVEETAPKPERGSENPPAASEGSGDEKSRAALSADALAGTASGGMGGWLPVVMVACAALALAAAALGRNARRSRDDV